MKKKLVVILGTGLAFLTIVFLVGRGWLLRRRQEAIAGAAAGGVAVASIGDLTAGTSASGRLLPRQQAQLAFATSGRVAEVYVNVGDWVRAGDPLVRLEDDDLRRAVAEARQNLAAQEADLAELLRPPDETDLAAARAEIASAQAQLDDLLAGPGKEDLARAQASLASAQAQLDELLAGPDKEELAQARSALVSAQAALRAAQARYKTLDDQLTIAQNRVDSARLQLDQAREAYEKLIWRNWKAADSWGPYSPQGVALKKAQINYNCALANYNLTKIEINDSGIKSAEAQVAQAQANLASLTREKTAQIASARARVARAKKNLALLTGDKSVQIASARAQLAQAQARLARLLRGPSDEQITIARARVEQARIQLEDAKARLEKATLTAPFDGVVTAVYVSVGKQVAGPAVGLVNPTDMQVALDVDEVDLPQVAIGQETLVTLEAWPDRKFKGKVTSIAPRGRNVAGIVTYEVRVDVDWSSGGETPVLLSGMTANADLVTARREKVLLIPSQAIILDRDTGEYYVNLIADGKVQRVPVTIGMRDSTYTEITSGLREGDRVLLRTAATSDRMRSPFARMMRSGGRRP